MPAMLLDQLAAMLVAGGPEGVAGALEELGNHEAQLRVIDMVWRIDGPYTSAVLTGIADAHPSRIVAKAARKALFKRHSEGFA